MKQCPLFRGAGSRGLELTTVPPPALCAGDVRAQVRAAVLNARDLTLANTASEAMPRLVPGPDAAGEVIDVGAGVTGLKVGDRVVTSFPPDRDAELRALTGGASGALGGELPPFALINLAQTLRGILVGSVAMGRALAAFCAQHATRPVTARVFAFERAPEADDHLQAARHFGKVVIALAADARGSAQ